MTAIHTASVIPAITRRPYSALTTPQLHQLLAVLRSEKPVSIQHGYKIGREIYHVEAEIMIRKLS